jgi:hypothetical protein
MVGICEYIYKSLRFIKVGFLTDNMYNRNLFKEDVAAWGGLTCEHLDVEEWRIF